jgi:hypothetical protein
MTEMAEWYMVENDAKHVRQVVLCLPPNARVPSRVKGSLIHSAALMKQQWAGVTLFIDGETPEQRGPFVFSKANNVVSLIEGCPAKVAFSFYHFRTGGVLQIFVYVDSPEVKAQTGYPFITENAHWPESEDTKEIVQALLERKDLDVCFVADTPDTPCKGQFGLCVTIPDDCRAALKREWEALNEHHFGIPQGQRDRQAAMRQFERENPMEENPVLESKKPAFPGASEPVVKSNVLATVSLILGIVAILTSCIGVLGVILGVAAFIAGTIAGRQMKPSDGTQKGAKMASAGRILGGVSVALGIMSSLAYLAFIVFSQRS